MTGLERRVADADAQTKFRSNKGRVRRRGRPIPSSEQILSESLAEFRKNLDKRIKKSKRTDNA